MGATGALDWDATQTASARIAGSVGCPVGEAAEAYVIDILADDMIRRTVTVDAPGWIYSAAHQTADFPSRPATIRSAFVRSARRWVLACLPSARQICPDDQPCSS